MPNGKTLIDKINVIICIFIRHIAFESRRPIAFYYPFAISLSNYHNIKK